MHNAGGLGALARVRQYSCHLSVALAKTDGLVAALLVAGGLFGRAGAQPLNDYYANAAVFPSVTNWVSGSITAATREPGEDVRFGYSVWWRWTAPSNGIFTFVAEAGLFRPFLLIGPSATNLLIGLTNPLFVGIMAPNTFATEFPVNAAGGTNYTIALFTYSNAPSVGDYTLRVTASAPPEVSFVQPSAYRMRHIVGEPLELQAEASDPDGQIQRVDFLMVATLLGSTSAPPYHIFAPTTGAIPDQDSRLFAVAVDDAGLFGVGGYSSGQIRQIAFRRPPPANDSFNTRVALSGGAVLVEANNGGAGREAGEPAASGEQTLWWAWTAPASGSYEILARGLLACPRLSVFTGDALESLSLVASDENSWCDLMAWVTVRAQAGQIYQLGVGDSCNSFGGPFTLHIVPTTAPAQIADVRLRRPGEVAHEAAVELFALGMQGRNWGVDFSTNLQHWQPCDEPLPFGWLHGMDDWADIFRAQFAPTPAGSSRFYRLHGTP